MSLKDTGQKPTLVYFENFTDPVGVEILDSQDHVELTRLRFAATDDSLEQLSKAHGFHLSPAVEMPDVYYPGRKLIESCPDLLGISSTGAGYDIVDVQACTDNGVVLMNQSGSNSQSVAEHVVGMALSLSKNIASSDKIMRRRTDYTREEVKGREISSKTIGILGLGNIGRITARMLGQGFGMNVIACDPYLDAQECERRGAQKVEFDELLARSDFLTVHTPKTQETTNLMNADAFSAMKPGAIFITTARGGIHNEDDLLSALQSGQLSGAGLDVWDREPPSTDHPLFGLDNVLASPHIAGITVEANYNMAKSAADQWAMLLKGEKPPLLVNTDVWPQFQDRFEQIMGFRPND